VTRIIFSELQPQDDSLATVVAYSVDVPCTVVRTYCRLAIERTQKLDSNTARLRQASEWPRPRGRTQHVFALLRSQKDTLW